jgi:hypothetical protein
LESYIIYREREGGKCTRPASEPADIAVKHRNVCQTSGLHTKRRRAGNLYLHFIFVKL